MIEEIKKTLSVPHLKRCGLFWVFWTSNSLEFDGSQSSVNSDVLRKGQLFTTVCTLKCAVYFS
ncbi:MAG: hypothetical protein KKE50_02125, partial [Nanoarchaeota archaeon]|nr:hypothetical protein [Nanoarchaeota archaeon]